VVLNERIGRITSDDLDVEGLTEREMARLLRLRDHYPYSEFAGSSKASCRAGKRAAPRTSIYFPWHPIGTISSIERWRTCGLLPTDLSLS
jgi:hypothetical protein